MRASRRRSWASTAGDIPLTVAAVLGALCITLVIAAVFFDVRIILFSTGSMSPAIPAGSAAIVRSIPAADVRPGDVITVERPGRLPITHRATSVEPVEDAGPDLRRITMRGDANAVEDPFPYDVTTVRLVVLSVPGIAPAIATLGEPWVLGGLTVAATLLVLWVFWPRRHEARAAAGAGRRSGAALGVVGLAAAAGVAGAVAPWAPAHAAAEERVIQGEVIRLVSIEGPRMSDLAPGTSAVWQVGVSAHAPTPGVIAVLLSSTGDAGLGLRYDVQECPTRWNDDGCPQARTLVGEERVPLDGVEREVLSLPSDDAAWLRIVVTRPGNADAAASGAVDMVVRAVGAGDDVSTSPEGLPATGAGLPWVLGGVALLLLAAGAGVAVQARRSS
ncbi:S24/S26 family peptidase [Microbacterium sp. HJ5]